AKEPYFITTQDGSSLALAGLWETWRDPTAAREAPPLITRPAITTQAVGRLADIHERMPLALPRQRWADWLDPARTDVTDLLAPPEPGWVDELELRPVSTVVNNVRNNGPELIEPVQPEATDLDDAALFDLPPDPQSPPPRSKPPTGPRGCRCTAPTRGWGRWCSATGPAAGSTRLTSSPGRGPLGPPKWTWPWWNSPIAWRDGGRRLRPNNSTPRGWRWSNTCRPPPSTSCRSCSAGVRRGREWRAAPCH